MAGLVSHPSTRLPVFLRCLLVRMVTFVRRVLLPEGCQHLNRVVGCYADIGSGRAEDRYLDWLVRSFSSGRTLTPCAGVGFDWSKRRLVLLCRLGHMEFRQEVGLDKCGIGNVRRD